MSPVWIIVMVCMIMLGIFCDYMMLRINKEPKKMKRKEPEESVFIQIYNQNINRLKNISVLVNTKNGVLYVIVANDDSSTMSVLYNTDGSVMTIADWESTNPTIHKEDNI